jgi:polyphosphate kinase 2 (PPK2 family)
MLLRPVSPRRALSLSDRDAKTPKGLPDKGTLAQALEKDQERLGKLQQLLYADGRYALLVVLQGRDASGKDGTIRSVFDACNPQGCQVTGFKAPTANELAHDFLWRIHNAMPPKGIIGIFNRSYYKTCSPFASGNSRPGACGSSAMARSTISSVTLPKTAS